MKVVLTHPYCWPYVRRGSERNLDNVARYLVGRGHDVTTVSSHPDHTTSEKDGSGLRLLHRPYKVPGMGLLHVETTHTFFFPAFRSLRSLQPDVVHSFFVTDALASTLARGRRHFRVLFQMNGIAIPGVSCRRFPPEERIWRQALDRVDERLTCSRFIGELLQRHYGKDFHAIPPPLRIQDFPFGAVPAVNQPTILSVADFTVPRKGVRVLIKAFAKLKGKVRDARLRLSGRMPDALRQELLRDLPDAVSRDIEVLGLGAAGDVPQQYRDAHVMALPAMWEPSGGSMLEAWASGTPVVAPNHGGLPEYFVDGVGVLFDPQTDGQETQNVDGLTEALIAALELSTQPGTRERCRAHAEQFSTEAIGPQLERMYAGQ